jgi:hypothetical protein
LKKLETLLVIALTLFTPLFAIPAVPVAGALPGLVCLSNTAGPCPPTPAAFDQAPGSLLRVAVNIQGSDALNGFDVQVKADPAFLQAADTDLTGSLLPTPTVVLKCIGGSLKTGNACTPQDGPGVVHLAAASLGFISTAPTSGLLFTAVYKVMAGSTGLPIGFNTGCTSSPTSVAGGVCVTIANGVAGAPPVPETAQGGTFSHGQDFTIAANPTSKNIPPGGTATSTITLTSQLGFTDTVVITPAVSAAVLQNSTATTALPLTVSVSMPAVLIPANGAVTLTLSMAAVSAAVFSSAITCSAIDPDTGQPVFSAGSCPLAYTVTVTATSTIGVTHSANVAATVTLPDFTIDASPTSLTIAAGSSGTSTITLGSISAFSGAVSLTATVAPAGTTVTLTPATVTLPADGTATSTLAITVPTVVEFLSYAVTVTGTSGALSHSVDLSFSVTTNDFMFSVDPGALLIIRSFPGTSLVNLVSAPAFSGSVSLSASVVPTGVHGTGSLVIATSFVPSAVSLTPGGAVSSVFTAFTLSSNDVGNYTATVVATSGLVVHKARISLTIADFSLALSKTAVTVIPGSPVKSTITGESLGGLTATFLFGVAFDGAAFLRTVPWLSPIPKLQRVRLVPIFYANGTQVPLSVITSIGPAAFVNRRQIFPDPIGGPDFATLTVASSANTKPGDYVVKVTGIAAAQTHTVTQNVHIPANPRFAEFEWDDILDLSATGSLQPFAMLVTNPNLDMSLFINVQISGQDQTGLLKFTANSGVIQLLPGQVELDIRINLVLTGLSVGQTFTFSAKIRWGLTATALTAVSTDHDAKAPISGSFTVGPP